MWNSSEPNFTTLMFHTYKYINKYVKMYFPNRANVTFIILIKNFWLINFILKM
jgi:hypothetical protein